jgi:hypothetical protein
MVGEIFNEHVRQDIIDAKALGLDGFALNFGRQQFPLSLMSTKDSNTLQTNSRTKDGQKEQ